MNSNIKILNFLKAILSVLKPFRIRLYTFFLIVHFLLIKYIFKIEIFNQFCSKYLPNKPFFCYDFITPNLFFIIPDIVILTFLWWQIQLFKGTIERKWLKQVEKGFSWALFLYIIFRLITLNYDVYNNIYYNIWYWWSLILIWLLFFIVHKNQEKTTSPDKEVENIVRKDIKLWDIDVVSYQNLIIRSIKSTLPKILDDITYNVFDSITYSWKIKIPNVAWIKSIKFENSDTVFVELNLHTVLINEIARLQWFNWTLAIEARWYIEWFHEAKWRSSWWKNGLVIKIKEQTIDFSAKYTYPDLLTPSSLLKNPLDFIVWVNEKWDPQVFNLAKLPHLLVAWSTWGWKSVTLNDILVSLMKNRLAGHNIEFILVDPKRVEFWLFKWLPWFNVITDIEEVVNMMNYEVAEMERRYSILEKAWCKNIEQYNAKWNNMSYRVIFIDEFASIMKRNKEIAAQFELCVERLSQESRASGEHMVIATQNPIWEVITSNMKSNLPARIGCKTVDWIKSTTIIDDTILATIKYKWEIYLKSDSGLTHLKSFYLDEETELKAFIDNYRAEEMSKHMVIPNSLKGVSIHQNTNTDSPTPFIELEQFLSENEQFDKYTTTYQIFTSLLKDNWYSSRSSMRTLCSVYNISNATADTLIKNLKEKELLIYKEKEKFNYLSEEPTKENCIFLVSLYNSIYNIIRQ